MRMQTAQIIVVYMGFRLFRGVAANRLPVSQLIDIRPYLSHGQIKPCGYFAADIQNLNVEWVPH